jgi:hypothetical protein
MVAAVPRSGTPETSSAPPSDAPAPTLAARTRLSPALGRLLAGAAVVLAVVLLFVAYLQVSRTYPENSDESNDLLMAWDMLHGNGLLHGWYLSDVSFITTELPQYALLVLLFGLHTNTAHIAAAMTYTLVVVLAVLLARGVAPGRDGWPRMLLTAGIMFAPQLGVAVFVLLLSLGHIGTAVPIMATWLVLDRLKPRWPAPVIVGLMLTWALVADPLVLVAGVVPLVAVCAVRVSRAVAAAGRESGRESGWLPASIPARVAAQWYEMSLAAAAIVAEGLASLVGRLIKASGGFILHPVPYQLAPVHTWPKHAYVTAQGLLALFGARPQGPAIELAFALVHLAGIALAAWAMWRVARHFISCPDVISQILLLAIVINVLVYVPSTLADATDLNAREFAIVLPFGAVLVGRTLAADWAARARNARARNARARNARAGDVQARDADARDARGWPRWRTWLAAAVVAAYAASLGYAAAQPAIPAANTTLARFLVAHHLTEGIGGYWESSVVTVGSAGAVTVRAVLPGTLKPDLWESKGSWYDPQAHRATFLVTDSASGFFNHWLPAPAALAALGRPARTYHVGTYTVYVWNKNLLVQVRQAAR